ncbi:PTS system mannose/fructose/sorbose family transporter subunit IID [Enterococcus hulanensis]
MNFPGLLFHIVLAMVVWYLHDKKNVSVIKLLLILIVLGAAGSLLHVF